MLLITTGFSVRPLWCPGCRRRRLIFGSDVVVVVVGAVMIFVGVAVNIVVVVVVVAVIIVVVLIDVDIVVSEAVNDVTNCAEAVLKRTLWFTCMICKL